MSSTSSLVVCGRDVYKSLSFPFFSLSLSLSLSIVVVSLIELNPSLFSQTSIPISFGSCFPEDVKEIVARAEERSRMDGMGWMQRRRRRGI